MERLRLIILLFFLTLAGFGQTTPYVIFQPCDLGIGVRVDQQYENTGFYAAGSKGNYRFDDGYLKDHIKLSLGIIGYVESWDSFFTVALNQHAYGDYKFPGEIPLNTLSRYSLDVGVGVRLKRLAVIISFDPIKVEGTVGFGIIIR